MGGDAAAKASLVGKEAEGSWMVVVKGSCPWGCVAGEEPKPRRTTLISSTVVSSVCIAMTRAWEEVGRSHDASERRRSASRPLES